MINFYIDESGVSSNDPTQPFYVFSAVVVPISSKSKLNTIMKSHIDSISSSISNIILSRINNNNYYTQPQLHKIKTWFLPNIESNFEFHSCDVYRGEKCFSILQKEERNNIFEKTLQILSENNIDVITIYCDKKKITWTKTMSKKIEENMCNKLLEKINEYLIKNNEEGIIFFDKGNSAVRDGILHESMKKLNLDINIVELDSQKELLIQLADACAYANNKTFANKKFKQDIAIDILQDIHSITEIII